MWCSSAADACSSRAASGRYGDAWEQHADAVAARVVAGQSAADLLTPGGAAPTVAVQREAKAGSKTGDPKPKESSATDAAPKGETKEGEPPAGKILGGIRARERLEAFPGLFNAAFADILTLAFGGELTSETAGTYFSDEQVELLTDFISTRVLPKRLFTGAKSNAALTAPKRILVASQMLADGKVAPDEDAAKAGGAKGGKGGSEPAKKHAEFCGHWTRLVYSYAGVTPPSGMEGPVAGKTGLTLDLVGPTGEINFGGGKKDKAPGKGVRNAKGADGKKDEEKDGKATGRKLPAFDDGDELFTALKPGDWLYVGDSKDSHSVIFAGWQGGIVASGTGKYRVAVLFSQLVNDIRKCKANKKGDIGGGAKHEWKLGYPEGAGVHVVTNVQRVTEDSGPVTTVEELFAFDESAAIKANAQTLKTYSRYSPAKVCAKLLERAEKLFKAVESKVAPNQVELISGALKSSKGTDTVEGLTRLVALVQMLKMGGGINGKIGFGYQFKDILPGVSFADIT